jgi:hypothetical protein
MDKCKNNFSSTWSYVQLLCFLIKLFAFIISILVSYLISLSTNLESSKFKKIWWKPFHESFLKWCCKFWWGFSFVIYKTFGSGLKHPKWAKKYYLQQCSKTLQVRRDKQNWNVMYKFSMNKLFKSNWLSTNQRSVMLPSQER